MDLCTDQILVKNEDDVMESIDIKYEPIDFKIEIKAEEEDYDVDRLENIGIKPIPHSSVSIETTSKVEDAEEDPHKLLELHSTANDSELDESYETSSEEGEVCMCVYDYQGRKIEFCGACVISSLKSLDPTNGVWTQTKDKRFKCNICNESFSLKYKLIAHLIVHTGQESFLCRICKKELDCKAYFERHIRIHTGEKPFICEICGKLYSHEGFAKRHMVVHTGQKPYKCKLCQKSFLYQTSLIRHTLMHTSEPSFTCSVCSKSFFQKVQLAQHERIHTSDRKTFPCKICNKTFSRVYTLRDHSTKQHPDM